MKGYSGKTLHIHLNSQETRIESHDENFYRTFIGNGILGAYYLLTKTKAHIDPYAGENLLMFLSSVMAGNDAPGLARYAVCGKSPMTGGIGESRCEGLFAQMLKKTGFDAIVIEGQCEQPTYILIENGKIQLRPATKLWGLVVSETNRILEQEHGSEISVAAIGPAGENLVRFASIISDKCHQAARSGLGAVMGSKKLKAIVLKGGQNVAVFDESAVKNRFSWFKEKMEQNQLSMWQHDQPGFSVWVHTHGLDASLGVENYRTAKCDYTDAYLPEHFLKHYKGEAPCPGCPNLCIKRYALEGDDECSGGIHQEISGAMGPNLGISDVAMIIHANSLCNELGMDPNSLGYTLSFIAECIKEELISVDDVNLNFGNEMELGKIINMIATREGIGDLLAEGSARAAQTIGKGAEYFALTVKGMEIHPFELRSQTNLALGAAVGPTGPRYEICEHDWDFDLEFGWDHTLNYCRTIGIIERIPMEYLGLDKVFNYKQLNNLWSAVDALGICLFSSAPTRVYSLEEMAKLLHEITGWETSAYEVMRIGERRNHIFRLYNNREGLTAEADTLPQHLFNEAIDFGAKKGSKLDPELFKAVVKEYYSMMGWDENGIPSNSTLRQYGLAEFIV